MGWGWGVGAESGTCTSLPCIKEGVGLRNISASLVLSDQFPGGGILELGNKSGKE